MLSAARLVSSVAVVALLSACAATSGSTHRGELDGAIRFSGGPVGAVFELRHGGQVRLVHAHHVVARERVRHGRGFRLSAPPGDYRLEGRSGDAMCRTRAVTLRPGSPVHADLICDVR